MDYINYLDDKIKKEENSRDFVKSAREILDLISIENDLKIKIYYTEILFNYIIINIDFVLESQKLINVLKLKLIELWQEEKWELAPYYYEEMFKVKM